MRVGLWLLIVFPEIVALELISMKIPSSQLL